MFVIVVGGGKVGYYLTKELIEAGHEVVLMEKDRGARRPDRRRDRLGRHPARRLRGQVPRRGRRQPGRHRGGRHRRRRGQPRRLPDGQAPLRRAADDRPRQQPQERAALPASRRRRDHQPDADDPRLDRAGHPGPRAAPPGAARGGRARADRGPLAGGLAGHRAGVRRTSTSPMAAPCSCSSATGSPTPIRPDTVLQEGDKVIAIGGRSARRSCTSS